MYPVCLGVPRTCSRKIEVAKTTDKEHEEMFSLTISYEWDKIEIQSEIWISIKSTKLQGNPTVRNRNQMLGTFDTLDSTNVELCKLERRIIDLYGTDMEYSPFRLGVFEYCISIQHCHNHYTHPKLPNYLVVVSV